MSRAYIRTLALACVLPSLEAARSVTSATLEVQDSLVCSVEEEPQHVQYGVKFSVHFPGGCTNVKCGKYFFSTVLPKMMLARQEASSCNCYGTGIMSKTGEPLPLLNFMSKSLATSCTPEECWSRYSKAMYLAKKADNPRLEPQQALARPEHWTLQCIDSQSASNTGLPTLVEVAAELNELGGKYADAVQDIIQQAAILGLEDTDATKGLSQDPVMQTEDQPSSPIDNYTPWAEIPASAPAELSDTLEEVGLAPANLPDSLDGLGSAPADLPDSLDGLGSSPADLPDSLDGLGSSPADLPDSLDGFGPAPADVRDSPDGIGSAPSTDLPDSLDGFGSAPVADDSLDGRGSELSDSFDGLGSAPSAAELFDSLDGLGSAPVADDALDELGSAPAELSDSLEGLGSTPAELPDLKHPAPAPAKPSASTEFEEEDEDPWNTAKCDAKRDDVSYAICMCSLANKRGSGRQLSEQCTLLSLPVKQRTTYWTCSSTRSRGKKSCAAKMQLSR
jgi:hypothetical protein